MTKPPFTPGHFDHSEYLKSWRKGLGVTQTTAAALLRVPVRSYQKWEIGRKTSTMIITACLGVMANMPKVSDAE